MGAILGRLPERQDMGYAYGGVVFLIYTWALRGFFYQLSSLILYHSVTDILAILAYMLALALLESLVAMAALLLLALILPQQWFAHGFGYKAFLTVMLAGAAAIGLEIFLTRKMTENLYLIAGPVLVALLLLGAILLFERIPRLESLLVGLVDRMSIFTYLYVPLGLLSLLVVLIRILG